MLPIGQFSSRAYYHGHKNLIRSIIGTGGGWTIAFPHRQPGVAIKGHSIKDKVYGTTKRHRTW